VVLKLNSTAEPERQEGREGREAEVVEAETSEVEENDLEVIEGDSLESAREAQCSSAMAVTAGPADGPGQPAEQAAPMAEISVAMQELAEFSRRYHARAEQREAVIDHLREEVERLRRGERRGLLRPMLADLCRLRDDLLKQAATLPSDFDAAKAAHLLRSYAETIELTLESNGVITYAPDDGDPFNPRMHRRVGDEPTDDPARTGHIAGVRRDGYLDIEANSPIVPAEVSVFAARKGEQ